MGNTSSKVPFSIAMLVYRSVTVSEQTVHPGQWIFFLVEAHGFHALGPSSVSKGRQIQRSEAMNEAQNEVLMV